MELLHYLPDYRVLICKRCQYAISPSRFQTHMRTRHRDTIGFRTYQEIRATRAIVDASYLWTDPGLEPIPIPPADALPIPSLPLQRGLGCLECPYVCCEPKSMLSHVGAAHPHLRRRRGRPSPLESEVNRTQPRWEDTFCQRFFVTGPQSGYFRVRPLIVDRPARSETGRSPEESMRVQVERQLEETAAAIHDWDRTIPDAATVTEVSPWLEMTRWPKYLGGHDFVETALLAAKPHPVREPLLWALAESVERVIEAGHRSIREDKVNVFDQARINSFIQRRRASNRPLMIQLRKATWRQYTSIWQRLVCFAYRTAQPAQSIQLSHRMTNAQLAHLDRVIRCGEAVLRQHNAYGPDDTSDYRDSRRPPEAGSRLDRAILLFCISLLDHTLQGDLFESTLVGFLAVLSIDCQKRVLQDASAYIPKLSALIKIGQILVIQRSVLAAEEGDVEHPANLLDEMRERFMIYGSRSPFNWALRLRAYGKKICNRTTSLGYIGWSDDKEQLSYKSTELRMDRFQGWVRTEVELIQTQLEDLLLLHPDERKEDIVPGFILHRLKDNPSKNTRSWSFLVDPRNQEELPDRSRWLLDRVLDNEWLRDEFLKIETKGPFHWLTHSVNHYLARVDRFLERLLLLVHLTSGQPARGTEIISLRYQNTVQGHLRNIFVEDGLVSTVTAYHKGYSVFGSTKIIHHYLPKEVGELLIYYLWLIRPFTEKLRRLAFGDKEPPSPFVWAAGKTSWDSSRLSSALKEEAKVHLHTDLNISVYRHIAIAISKTHLACGGFKRDCGLEDNPADGQATHTPWTAGTIYARGLEEAPGHVEARRAEYRAVSREWHAFLGFQTYLSKRKHALDEIINDSGSKRRKQAKREEWG